MLKQINKQAQQQQQNQTTAQGMADTEQRRKDDKNPRDKSGRVAHHVLDTRPQDRVSGGLPAQASYLLKVGK